LKNQGDFHFPVSERSERAGIISPVLLSLFEANQSAALRNPKTEETGVLEVGKGTLWGCELLHVGAEYIVLVHTFDQWAEMEFVYPEARLTPGTAQRNRMASGDKSSAVPRGTSPAKEAVAIRKPVGRLTKLGQPLYSVLDTDPDYSCKQDTDPTDWLTRVAANISIGGEEPSPDAAASVMAPNTDTGLLGNPEVNTSRSRFIAV
jgi:hypothetical protein